MFESALLASESASRSSGFNWLYIFNPAVVWVFIPIIAILTGTVTSIVKKCQRHRERMAMIAAGMHPDFAPGEEPDMDNDHGAALAATAHHSTGA